MFAQADCFISSYTRKRVRKSEKERNTLIMENAEFNLRFNLKLLMDTTLRARTIRTQMYGRRVCHVTVLISVMRIHAKFCFIVN